MDFHGDESPGDSSRFGSGYGAFDESSRFDSFRYSDEAKEELEVDADYKDVNEYGQVVHEYEASGFDGNLGMPVADTPSPFGDSFTSGQHADFASGGDFGSGGDFSPTFVASDENGYGYAAQSGFANGSVLPPPEEMEPEEGFLLREWKRQNAARLEEKQRIEKERLEQIAEEANSYKENFYAKRRAHCDSSKKNNRDKEQNFVSNQEHFHSTAEKHYWKAVVELIPKEVTTFESKRSAKDKEKKKTTVIFNNGPKPGKATDLSRMRQILLKLKHNPPEHMKATAPPPVTKPEATTAEGDIPKAESPVAGSLPLVVSSA